MAANFMQSGITWANRMMMVAAGEVAQYVRGTTTISVTVTTGSPYAFRVDQGDGATVLIYSDADFIVPAAALVVGGALVVPAQGDRIIRTVAGHLETYELMNIPGEKPWRWHDPNHETIRIHAKLIGKVLLS